MHPHETSKRAVTRQEAKQTAHDHPSIWICPLMLWSSPSNMSKPLYGKGRPANKALMSSTTTCPKKDNTYTRAMQHESRGELGV